MNIFISIELTVRHWSMKWSNRRQLLKIFEGECFSDFYVASVENPLADQKYRMAHAIQSFRILGA